METISWEFKLKEQDQIIKIADKIIDLICDKKIKLNKLQAVYCLIQVCKSFEDIEGIKINLSDMSMSKEDTFIFFKKAV